MPERFDVQISARAARALKKLDRGAQKRILMAVNLLRDQPRPPGARALAGRPGYLRVRVGEYRIVYTVDDGVLVVLVLAVGHRREIYQRLP